MKEIVFWLSSPKHTIKIFPHTTHNRIVDVKHYVYISYFITKMMSCKQQISKHSKLDCKALCNLLSVKVITTSVI